MSKTWQLQEGECDLQNFITGKNWRMEALCKLNTVYTILFQTNEFRKISTSEL